LGREVVWAKGGLKSRGCPKSVNTRVFTQEGKKWWILRQQGWRDTGEIIRRKGHTVVG